MLYVWQYYLIITVGLIVNFWIEAEFAPTRQANLLLADVSVT